MPKLFKSKSSRIQKLVPFISQISIFLADFDPENKCVTYRLFIAVLLVIYWNTEAIPLVVKALLPVAKAPNAIVFGNRRIRVKEMLRTRILLTVTGIRSAILVMYFWRTGYLFSMFRYFPIGQ